MIGTFINAGAIIAGTSIGLLIHNKLPKKIVTLVFQSIGLFTLYIGISMSLKANELLFMVLSLVLGSITGELLNLEKITNQISNRIKKLTKSENAKFTEGLITSFLLFCMGSMTILGAIDEGLGNKPDLLLAKSVLDGFSSIALGAALGFGVAFSVIPLILYQGGLTLLAYFFGNYFAANIITELSATGGILLIGMGINILEIKTINVLNMLPALLYIVLLTAIF